MHELRPEPGDALVTDILDDSILRGEQSFGWIRMLACIGALAQIVLLGPSWLQQDRLNVVCVVLGITVLSSAILLRQFQARGLSTPKLVASLTIDRLAIFLILVCLMMWPSAA